MIVIQYLDQNILKGNSQISININLPHLTHNTTIEAILQKDVKDDHKEMLQTLEELQEN